MTWLKAAGSTVANYFTSRFCCRTIDTLFEENKRENELRNAREKFRNAREIKKRNIVTPVLDFLQNLVGTAIYLLLFFPRLALRGVNRCFGPCSQDGCDRYHTPSS